MFGQIILTIALVLLNGFFVAAEFAIVKIRVSQLELKAKEGNRMAIMARSIVQHLDAYLAATQLGITLASLGLGWIGEPVVSQLIINAMQGLGISLSEESAHNIALPVAFAIITILHIVFGELAPKSIAIQRSEKTTLMISYPLRFFYVIFKPFIWLLNGIAGKLLKLIGITAAHGSEVHSSEEMKYLVQQGREGGIIDKSEYDIIISAFNFSERTIRQIMIPRPRVSAIDLNAPLQTQTEKIIAEGYSRYPVYKENLDAIVGIVYTKDVLVKLGSGHLDDLTELIRKPFFVPENMHVGQLLREFQRRHQQIAVVVDEYGNTEGTVTMEDILEELVGEIQDEYDEENPFVQHKNENTYLVQAQNSLININNDLPEPIETSSDYTTLAGAIIHKLRRIPAVGEVLKLGAYKVTILEKDNNSIDIVQLQKHL